MIRALNQPLGLVVHDGSAGTDLGSAILDTFKRLTELLEHTRKDMRKHQVSIIIPDGQCKFPRLWPPQTPPGKDEAIMTGLC